MARIPTSRTLSDEERRVVAASYYLARSDTVEEAEAKMREAHGTLSDSEITAAMDEAVAAKISARMAEEAYAFTHGEQLDEEEQRDIEEEEQRELEEGNIAFEFEGQLMQEQQGGGFADVIWETKSGRKVQVRVDFSAGESLSEVMDSAQLDAEDATAEYGGDSLDMSIPPEVLGVYYTR